MLNYKKILLLICLFISIILSSCTSNKKVHENSEISNDGKEPEQIILYDITKGSNYKDFTQGRMDYIEYEVLSTENVNYYFEIDQYTENQMNEFINNVETLCTNFESEYHIFFEEAISIFISDKIKFGSENRKIFLNNFDLKTNDVTIAFLQAIYGDTTNYGLAYGISCHINESLYRASVSPKTTINKLKKYYSSSENLRIMDLAIPVFRNEYFGEEENKYAYSTSYYFVKSLIEGKGLEYSLALLKDSSKLEIDFDIEYTKEKNNWLESIGAEKSCEVPTIPIRYKLSLGRNSNTYPYAIYTPSTISYFSPKEYFSYEGITMTYDYINHYLTMYEQDINALKDYLSPYIDTNKEVIICTFKQKDTGMSYYHGDNQGISYSSPLYAGAHEYTHYLTSKKVLPVWMTEGIADYCANYLENKGVYRMMSEYIDKTGSSRVKDLYNKNLSAGNKEIDDSFLYFNNELKAYYNSKRTDDSKRTILDVYYNAASIGEEGERSLSYNEASSLVNYLIKTYGENKFFDLYDDYSKLDEIYGKSFMELKEEWLQKLDSTIILD